jgi:serine/threonine protein kinase
MHSFNLLDKVGRELDFSVNMTHCLLLFAENMLLTGDQRTVKLVDLGLAREETLTEMMTAETGTYRWMAPEVILFKRWIFFMQFNTSNLKHFPFPPLQNISIYCEL